MKNAMSGLISLLFLMISPWQIVAQTVLSGYVFEENNRQYVALAHIRASDTEGLTRGETFSDEDGRYALSLPPGRYVLLTQKDAFEPKRDTVTLAEERLLVNIRLSRKPVCLFQAALAQTQPTPDAPAEAIGGAVIEVFNLTTGQTELYLDRHPEPFFSFMPEQGNHYVILVRKTGFLSRRIELRVGMEGCVFRTEGIEDLRPDDATADTLLDIGANISTATPNTSGTVLAHIELEKAELDRRISLPNVRCDRDMDAHPQPGLDKARQFLLENPGLGVEIGVYTDLRGGHARNDRQSLRCAEDAARYLAGKGIAPERVRAAGYGKRQPVKKCRKCSEANRQRGRRAELRIVSIESEERERLHWQSLEQIVREEHARAPHPRLLPEANNSVPLPPLQRGKNR